MTHAPKNAGKLPAFQFYPADWRKDSAVQSLDYETRGIWFEILCIMHESEERGVLLLNGKPMPENALARLLGLDNQILTTRLTTLLTYGVARRRDEDGALFSKRMVCDEKLRQIRKVAGSKGGNPVLLNQKPTTQVNQNPTPSSSSSSSSSASTDSAKVRKKPKAAPATDPDFDRFYEAYPKKRARKTALEAWVKANRPPLETILKAVHDQTKSRDWTKDDGQWIPLPATWLNQARWEDELQPATNGNHSDTFL